MPIHKDCVYLQLNHAHPQGMYLFAVKSCPADIAQHSTRSPNTGTYVYNSDVTYSCDPGYEHTSENLSRTCKSDTTWTGSLPVCTSKFANLNCMTVPILFYAQL